MEEAIENKIKVYSNMDIMKFIAAIFVCFLHGGSFYEYGEVGLYLHSIIFRLAVPLFFMMSGFFLGQKILRCKNDREVEKQVYVNYIKRLLVPYIGWSVFYILFLLLKENTLGLYTFLTYFKLVVCLKSPTIVWYMGALIGIVIILIHMNNKRRLIRLIIFSTICIYIGTLFNAYDFILINTPIGILIQWLKDTFISQDNIWCMGLFYTTIGFYLGKYGIPKRFNKISINVIGFVVAMILITVETYYIINQTGTYHQNLIFQPVAVVGLFLSLVLLPQLNISTLYFRKTSSIVYYIHVAIYWIFAIVEVKHPLKITGYIRAYWIVIFISIIIALIYCIIIGQWKKVGDRKAIDYIEKI